MKEFQARHVFGVLAWTVEDPDYVLSGTIYRFTAREEEDWWLRIPIVSAIALLGVPGVHIETIVDIELMLMRRSGKIARRYRVSIPMRESLTVTDEEAWSIGEAHHHVKTLLAPRLNQAFSAAVTQLRDQLLRDPALAIAIR